MCPGRAGYLPMERVPGGNMIRITWTTVTTLGRAAKRKNLKYKEGYRKIVLDAERSETRRWRDTNEMRERNGMLEILQNKAPKIIRTTSFFSTHFIFEGFSCGLVKSKWSE